MATFEHFRSERWRNVAGLFMEYEVVLDEEVFPDRSVWLEKRVLDPLVVFDCVS